MDDRDIPLPLDFRTEMLERLMPRLQAGECCSLIGVSGVGKSNLARFLHRRDVQEKYWNGNQIWAVPIDAQSLTTEQLEDDIVSVEPMLHRLIREADQRQMPAELINELDELHNRLVSKPNPLLALRYLERACARLCETYGLRLVFVFDQFEDMWSSLDAQVFRNLRYLRDEFKYRVMYLVITRERLQRSRQRNDDDLLAVEGFWELFTSHVFGLGMYSPRDATVMLERLAYRRKIDLHDELRRLAMETSGRHPSLLRAVFWALSENGDLKVDYGQLLQHAAISEECAKVWQDLTQDQQRCVRSVVSNADTSQAGVLIPHELLIKEVVSGNPPTVFSPVFAAYVRTRLGNETTGIIVKRHQRQVWIDGQRLSVNLSRLEFQLLEILARNASKVCQREDILQELYEEPIYIVHAQRLDTLLRRLRESLGEHGRRYLVTHRGVGLELKLGRLVD